MNFGTLIGVVGGILGLVGLVAAAVVVARSSIAQNTIRLLEDNTSALSKRVEIMEAENEQLRLRVSTLEAINTDLLIQVKSVPEYGVLAKTVNENFRDVLTEIKDLATEHRKIIVLLEART